MSKKKPNITFTFSSIIQINNLLLKCFTTFKNFKLLSSLSSSSLLNFLLIFLITLASECFSQQLSLRDPVFISYPLTKSLNPAIAVNDKEKIFAVWEERETTSFNSKSRIYYTESTDGINWIAPYPITETNRWDGQPDIAVDNNGFPHVVWAEWLGGVYYSWYNGQQWSVREFISTGSYPYILIDKMNYVHLFWSGNERVRHTYNNGTSWSEIEAVSDTSYHCGGSVDFVVDDNNDIHIVFTTSGATSISNYPSVLYRKREKGNWGLITNVSHDSLNSLDPQIEISNTCDIIIVWKQHIQSLPTISRIYWSQFKNEQWIFPNQISGQDSFNRVYTPRLVKDNSNFIYLFWGADVNDYYSYIDDSNWHTPILYSSDTFTTIESATGINKKFHSVFNKHLDWYSQGSNIYYANDEYVTDVKDEITNTKLLEIKISNYPNPFNSQTTLYYETNKISIVKIIIYDILGREIRILANSWQNIGEHQLLFNANNLPSGVYLCSLQIDEEIKTIKLQLIK